MSHAEGDEAVYGGTAASRHSRHVEELVYAVIAALATSALDQSLGPVKERIGGPLYSFLVLCLAGALWGLFSRFGHYLKILSGAEHPTGTPKRKIYDQFLANRLRGGTPVSVYADRLNRSLSQVDRFFGDCNKAMETPVTRLFGLRTPAHVWTAPALERCILLAYVYPQLAILFVWLISGQSGPVEYALGLPQGRSGVIRSLAAATIIISVFAYVQSYRAATKIRGAANKRSVWSAFVGWFSVMILSAFGTDLLLTTYNVGAVAGAVALTSSVIGGVAGDSFLAVGSALGGGTIAAFAAGFNYRVATISSISAITAAGVFLAVTGLRLPKPSGSALFGFLILAVAASLAGARMLSQSVLWPLLGPLLLFFGLFSVLNAPFNWFSLGLTRALLRRGSESNNWWPYFYALVDAVVAVFVIMLLTAVLVLAVQTFDLLATIGGGSQKAVLPLIGSANRGIEPLFNGIATNPGAPQYWWLYGLLLATVIPSIANLIIGGLSLTRGVALITNYARRQMSDLSRVNRNWIAFLLTAQDFLGVITGVGVQALLVFIILGQLLPLFGTNLLAADQWLADLNLPSLLLVQ